MQLEMDLLEAIAIGTVEDIEDLIARGADIRKLPGHGLNLAIGRSHFGPHEVLRCLLEHGADPNQESAIVDACFRGDADVVKLLLDHGIAHDSEAMRDALYRVISMVYSDERKINWLKKLQHLLQHMRKASAPFDDPMLSEIAKEHPWVLK